MSEPRFVRANPKVRADEGKVCVMWGPLVYTVEETDNGENLQALYIDTAKPVKKLSLIHIYIGVCLFPIPIGLSFLYKFF